MHKLNHPVEKTVQTIIYKGVEFVVVERPEVLWAGCVDYASNNTDESNIDFTLKRFQKLISEGVVPTEKINPEWGAALSINYTCKDKPCGIMFGNEVYSAKQDERFDIITQPGGLWLRVRNDEESAMQFLGYDKTKPFNPWEYGTYRYFAGETAPLQSAARENGYIQNPDIHIQIEYHCHNEYGKPPHTNYAYIPIIKS